ncbi:leukocyte receptor cluster member 9 [Aplysia californica]|uniref:Leukocyte receptor cluster member 9 n=1 Tax=Aplysia californica TaxID=6500 RepID=A0ABM0JH13_APLCA|nr:leukocyte receptor cluster member 9 [Aplysia californica]XP_005093491.1 leukocyte receptor cluster member 9 [Aplysia californica]XP_005093492.1 leukocyte receptor cluster member 9 [Aplysia californica]
MAGTESSGIISEQKSAAAVQQDAELAAVKAAFPNRCRVISNSGKFSNVVTLQPENLDATIKFHLPASYPSVAPEISIRSESITKPNIADIEEFLKSKAQTLLGQEMLLSLTNDAQGKFYEVGLRPGKTSIVDSHTYLGKKPVKKRPKRKPKSEDEKDENEKLPPMKTADDVVKRIIWDENLDKDDFVVGYIDRFRGLMEKYFSAFSWEDLSAVDYDVLAVPKHRIQYFSYKGVKVWDKPRRVDNVFGSASGTKTIDVVIRELEQEQSTGQQAVGVESNLKNQREEDEESYSSSDDDDDDGIVVTIGGAAGSVSTSQSSIGRSSSNTESAMDVDSVEKQAPGYDPYWQDKLRPNYFLCVRITNEKIRDQIGNVQDHLMEVEPLFGECCIPGAALHLTLCTVGLDTAEQLQECMSALNKAKQELAAGLPKSTLKFHGVSNFYNRVIYAKVQYEKDFIDFHNLLKQVLSQAGVQVRDGYDFVPHVTVMKTTRPVSRLRGTKNISPKVYEKFLEMEFGEQKVEGIYLCSMGDERRDDGFYLTPTELHFPPN